MDQNQSNTTGNSMTMIVALAVVAALCFSAFLFFGKRASDSSTTTGAAVTAAEAAKTSADAAKSAADSAVEAAKDAADPVAPAASN